MLARHKDAKTWNDGLDSLPYIIFNENKITDTIIVILICRPPYQLDWLVSHISLMKDMIISFFARLMPDWRAGSDGSPPTPLVIKSRVKLNICCFIKLTSSDIVLTKYGNTCSGKHEFEWRIHNTYIIHKLQSLNRNNDRFYCLFLFFLLGQQRLDTLIEVVF